MTKYLSDSPFSVHPGANKAYRDNFDAVFGKKEEVKETKSKQKKKTSKKSTKKKKKK